jgi:hypothetical protein
MSSDSLYNVGLVALASSNPAEAYRCFSSVVEADSNRYDAWAGKAKAAGWMSTLNDYRWQEMEACTKAAIALCPDEERASLVLALATEAISVAIAVHNLAFNHVHQHGVMVIPEQFGLGIMKKAKPLQQVIDTYYNVVTTAIIASGNAIKLAELNNVATVDLYTRTFRMVKNVFITGEITADGADYGYKSVTLKFPMQMSSLVNELVNQLLPTARKLDSNFPDPREEVVQAELSAKNASSCFIATAALGTTLHPDLDILRTFRDNVLATCTAGRSFISVYYRISPPVAKIIAKYWFLRKIALFVIVRPSVSIANNANNMKRHRFCKNTY